MPRSEKSLTLVVFLAILSLAALFLAHLALTDIHHGEADLTLEWWVLRGAAAVILAFIIVTLATVRNIRRTLRRSARHDGRTGC